MTVYISDVMTSPVVFLQPYASLKDAHELTREKGIRHLPVVDPETNAVIGIVTQKKMIATVLSLLNQFGSAALSEKEAETNIMNVAVTDFDSVRSNDRLIDVAEFFLDNKHGCLPVTNQKNELEGIISSSDFVKLAINLLSG